MTAMDVDVAKTAARPAKGGVPALLVALFLLIKMGQFALAGVAVHAGVADAKFATGYPMVAWDSMHYMAIAAHGYPATFKEMPENICFFPVLPLLSRPLIPLLGVGLAVLAVSNAAALVGLWVFYAWCRRTMGERVAFWSCLLMLAYPPGMFLSAAYTEGIFLITTGTALYFTSSRRPWLAAVAAGVGSASRPTGIMVSVVVVADAAWQMWHGELAKSIPKIIAMTLISVSGLAAFSTFLTVRYGSPLVYFGAQECFAGDAANVNGAAAASSPASTGAGVPQAVAAESPRGIAGWVWQKVTTAGSWNKIFAVSGALVSVLLLIPRLPIPRHIVALPLLIFLLGFLPNWGIRLNSCARYLVEGLPLFAATAYMLTRRAGGAPLRVAVVLLGFAIQCVYIWEFTRGEWAG